MSVEIERVVISADAICGNCGNAYSKHYFEPYGEEQRVYCNMLTNGDIFTDTPSDGVIFDMLLEDHPGLYDYYLAKWRREHKHL